MLEFIRNKRNKLYFTIYTCLVICSNMVVTVYAEEDPVTIINNLSDMIFQLITAVGGIILGMGVVQFGMSWKSHDPSQRANGLLGILGGIIIISAKYIMNRITK